MIFASIIEGACLSLLIRVLMGPDEPTDLDDQDDQVPFSVHLPRVIRVFWLGRRSNHQPLCFCDSKIRELQFPGMNLLPTLTGS